MEVGKCVLRVGQSTKLSLDIDFLYILRLDNMLEQLSEAVVFNKIDLKGDYYQIKIRQGDGWKTAFKTKDDHSKFQQRKYGSYQIIKRINNMLIWLTYKVGCRFQRSSMLLILPCFSNI